MRPKRATFLSLIVVVLAGGISQPVRSEDGASSNFFQADATERLDILSSMWSYYKYRYIQDGRVVSLDEDGVTTSEGQSYAMLRSVWIDDQAAFKEIWEWTAKNLRLPTTGLFAWKFKGEILDRHSASDADCDIALALVLASQAFDVPEYLEEAKLVMQAIWSHEVVKSESGRHYLVAGDWSKRDETNIVHLGYFAPASYEVFSKYDKRSDWPALIQDGYEVLDKIYSQNKFVMWPVERFSVFEAESLLSEKGATRTSTARRMGNKQSSYDVFPLPWRIALDREWHGRDVRSFSEKFLGSLESTSSDKDFRIMDRHLSKGVPLSKNEALPLYATAFPLAVHGSDLHENLKQKILNLVKIYQDTESTPYYLQNWLWFSLAAHHGLTKNSPSFAERVTGIHPKQIVDYLPTSLIAIISILFLLKGSHRWIETTLLTACLLVLIEYSFWRVGTLNTRTLASSVFSISLFFAEMFSICMVALPAFPKLTSLSSLARHDKRAINATPTCNSHSTPPVAIFLPIYNEPLSILEMTLLGLSDIDYPSVTIYILDDGHRTDVSQMCSQFRMNYVLGPRMHAKAGNLNHALAVTDEPFILILDTDHIPCPSILKEMMPQFNDDSVGYVQTPHLFYNEDIFQRGFSCFKRLAHESAFFHFAIQPLKCETNSVVFSGTGAVFRRAALIDSGGFRTESITEDILTGQWIHSKGWSARYLKKPVAVGLDAESYSSFLLQRKRWMQGCLQVLFRQSSVFFEGLSVQQKISYFSSHMYFLFPVARIIYLIAPVAFLMFHVYPILADVPEFVGKWIPVALASAYINATLYPGWRRSFWKDVQESVLLFPLLIGLIEMALPKKLGFKVTPKGIFSKRSFDYVSASGAICAICVSICVLTYGGYQLYKHQIEISAYVFNISWLSIGLFYLLASLVVAFERKQERIFPRFAKVINAQISCSHKVSPCLTQNFSLSGTMIFVHSSAKSERPPCGCGAFQLSFEDDSILFEEELLLVKASGSDGNSCLHLRFVNLSKRGKSTIMRWFISSSVERLGSNRRQVKVFFPRLNQLFEHLVLQFESKVFNIWRSP